MLARLDLHTARDVLFFFPRTYQDMTELRDVDQLEEDKLQSVCGTVEEFELRGSQPGRCMLGVLVRSASGHLRGMWFNQPFMQEKFKVGQRVVFSGKPKHQGLVWQMSHPKVDFLADDDETPKGRIVPVYPLTEGILQWQMRKWSPRRSPLSPTCWKKSSPKTTGRYTTSGRCSERSARSTRPTAPRSWPPRGGGWPIRNCSSWVWPWP